MPGFYLLRNIAWMFLLKNDRANSQIMKLLRTRFQPSSQPCAAGGGILDKQRALPCLFILRSPQKIKGGKVKVKLEVFPILRYY